MGKVTFDKLLGIVLLHNHDVSDISGLITTSTGIIEVDSINGDDATDTKKTLAAALAAAEPIIETFVANTTLNSNSLYIPAGLDTTMTVGRKICGAGIPYGTTIIGAGGPNSLTISNNATATATGVTLTVEEEITIKTFGNFEVFNNLFKDGVKWDFGNSIITWGNLTLYDWGANIMKHNQEVIGGIWIGFHANSKFFDGDATQNPLNWFTFKPKSVISNTTGYLFQTNYNNWGTNVHIDSDSIRCPFGQLLYVSPRYANQPYSVKWNVRYSEHLLGTGLVFEGRDLDIEGYIKSPSNVRNLYTNMSPNVNIKGILDGLFYFDSAPVVNMACTLNGQGTSFIVNGSFKFDGYISSTSSIIDFYSGVIAHLTGQAWGTFNVRSTSKVNSFIRGLDLTVNCYNTSTFKNYTDQYAMSCRTYDTSKASNYGDWSGGQNFIQVHGGRFDNYKYITSNLYSPVYIPVGGGVYCDNNSITECTHTYANATCIYKGGGCYQSKGGTLYVGNTNSPIWCFEDTAAAKKVEYRGLKTNCNKTTYGALLAANTGYAPVPTIVNNLDEDTSYTD